MNVLLTGVGHYMASVRVLGEQGSHLVNLGTGRGYSVLEVIEAHARAADSLGAVAASPERCRHRVHGPNPRLNFARMADEA